MARSDSRRSRPGGRGAGGLPRRLACLTLLVGAAACGEPTPRHTVIPLPVSAELSEADTFVIAEGTRITFDEGDPEAERIGRVLAGWIGNTVETTPEVVASGSGSAPSGPTMGPEPGPDIHLTRVGADASLGDEGYELVVTDSLATVRATGGAGLFYGAQTIRQLLPPVVEYTAAYPRPLFVPVGRIVDRPRFEWRGAMLDVARHFRPVADVKRFVDLMALYKLNRLHLHLSDDQGWRIEIPGWPQLTEHGGSTQVGGLGGGYYTADDYTEIVAYAADRFITVVPEIDMPGHTNAALSSYPELSCDGRAPELYTGTEVGFSSLCTDAEVTYDFLDDVVREIAALTPGPYFHVGGDEARQTEDEDYVAFIERAQDIVEAHGKRMIGWDEVATARLSASSLVQLWRPLWPDPGAPAPEGAAADAARTLEEGADRAVEVGARFILSPADRIYLDMKYDTTTVIGLAWAGLSDPRRAYAWEPTEIFSQIPEASIAGVEATLWSETMGSLDDVEYLAFPRLAGVAEMGWSAAGARDWEEYRRRLGAHGARWTALGVNFHRSPQIDWTLDPR
ncbi:MAG: family 20 glycosylhydrolase [Gemmatimonadota bacterium]|jgi:hexosaminidase